MNAEFSAVCDRLLAALLNGVGQGLLLVLLLAGLLPLIRRANAATRHALELTTLLLLALLPVMHFCLQSSNPNWLASSSVRAPDEQLPPLTVLPEQMSPSEESTPIPDDNVTVPLTSSHETSSDTDVAPAIARSLSWQIWLPRYTSELLILTGSLLALMRLGVLVWQLCVLRALKRNGFSAPEPVRELFSRLCVELRVSRAPQLRVAKKITAPMAVGFRQPAVLLPENLCGKGTNAQLEPILRHELAHVLRKDDWANLLQQTIRALFFFHPGVFWLSRRITVDREIACDDHVLHALRDRKSYALSLTEFAGRKESRDLIAAPAAWSSHTQLKQRIDMILDTKRNASPRLARGKASLFAAAAILVAALAFHAAPRLAFAEAAVEAPPAEPATPAEPAAQATLTEPAAPADESAPRVKAAIVAPTPLPPGTAIIAGPGHVPPVASVVAPGRVWYAATAAAADDEPGPPPRAKSRARGGDDAIERRLDRLERLVEKLVQRDAEKKNFQFDFHEKMNPGNFNFNNEDMGKFQEKIRKDVENAKRDAEKATKDQNRFGYKVGDERQGLEAARKALEEQRQVLEKQVQDLQRQIQKLEREQQRIEQNRARDEKRRARDAQNQEDENDEKEKDAPKR